MSTARCVSYFFGIILCFQLLEAKGVEWLKGKGKENVGHCKKAQLL
jgi:hypothetical protein